MRETRIKCATARRRAMGLGKHMVRMQVGMERWPQHGGAAGPWCAQATTSAHAHPPWTNQGSGPAQQRVEGRTCEKLIVPSFLASKIASFGKELTVRSRDRYRVLNSAPVCAISQSLSSSTLRCPSVSLVPLPKFLGPPLSTFPPESGPSRSQRFPARREGERVFKGLRERVTKAPWVTAIKVALSFIDSFVEFAKPRCGLVSS